MKSNIRIRFDRISILMLLALLIEEPLSYTATLLLAAFLHECGHFFVAHLLGIPISSLHISILGAQLELRDPLLSYRREWLLCFAGPLFSFAAAAVGGLLLLVFPNVPLLCHFVMTSCALGIVNLLPIGCLDGGRMFRAMCRQLLPHRAASIFLESLSFIFLLILWMTSVYMMIRMGNSLKLFIFSFSLFFRFFVKNRV